MVIHSMRTVGSTIRKMREQRGMTQQGLADKAAVSRVTISNIERGSDIAVSNLLSIGKALGIQLALLGEMNDSSQAEPEFEFSDPV